MSTDAIVLLKDDDKEIKKLFRQFEDAGANAHVRKGQLVKKIIELLTMHTYIENEVMYPEIRKLVPHVEARKKAPRSPAQPSALKKALDAVVS
jgi:hemerythrin superfamily protein